MASQPYSVLVEAAACLLQHAGGSLPITSLNKALFYLDLHALLEHGSTVTDTTYLALSRGPVVAKYEKRLVQALEDAGLAQQEEAEDGYGKPVSLVVEPSCERLTPSQIDLARQVAAWAKKNSAKALSDYSHRNAGWKAAWEAGLGGLSGHAEKVNLRVAMQQIVEDDEWLSAPADPGVIKAFSGADRESGDAW